MLSVLSGDSNTKQQKDSKAGDLVVESIPGEVTPEEGADGQQAEGDQPSEADHGEDNQDLEKPVSADKNPKPNEEEEQSKETGNQTPGEGNQEGDISPEQGEVQEGESQEIGRAHV